MTIQRCTEADRIRERKLADYLERVFQCRMVATRDVYKSFDFRTYRDPDPDPIALVEIKGASIDVFQYPTVFVRVDKFNWLMNAQREEGAPAVYLKACPGRLGWILIDEIAERYDQLERGVINGRDDRGEVGIVFHDIVKVPRPLFRTMTRADAETWDRCSPGFIRFAALCEDCLSRWPRPAPRPAVFVPVPADNQLSIF